MATLADSNKGAFKGTVNSAELATIFGQGARYAVLGVDDLKVTQGSGDRGVAVAAGRAWGDGVLSEWDTGANLNGAAVSSGSRWDTVAVRRTWQPTQTPTGTAELILLQGSSTKAIAASRTTDAGVTTSDQPIALARFDAGSTTVADIVDVRVWAGAGGGLVAGDAAALGYLGAVGTTVRVGDVTWVSAPSDSGGVAWTTTLDPQRLSLFGAGPSLLGSGYAPNGWLIQAGSTAQDSNLAGSSAPGAARVTYPHQFPNGVLTVLAFNGHDAAARVQYSLTPTGYSNYRDSFVYMVRNLNGDPAMGVRHRINWLAIGY